MIRRLRGDEGGWALVTAVIVTALMVSLGIASYGFVDGQQGQSRKQRERESAFNLAEGALTQQLYILSQRWPSSAGTNDYSAACTDQTPSNSLCPSPSEVAKTFNSVDFTPAAAWRISVRDNKPPYDRFWSDAVLGDPSVAAFDQSGRRDDGTVGPDERVWVRAEGTARGRTRALVALARVETLPVRFPRSPFMVGAIDFGNNSKKKTFADTTGSTASYVRNGLTCASIDQEISPCNLQAATADTAVSPGALEALRQTAKNQGTYWQDCASVSEPGPTNNPSASAKTAVYFAESGSCHWSGNRTWNSAARPGIFVAASGTIRFTGSGSFHGVIYAANGQGSSATVVDLGGNMSVYGAVMIDGSGRLQTGGSGNSSRDSNIEYRDVSLSDISAYGTAGVIQNTWRELRGGG